MAASIPEAEFRGWYSIRDAIEFLERHGFDTHEARQAILHGLRTDQIGAAAEWTHKSSRVPNKHDEHLPLAPMRSPHWLFAEPSDAFWTDGHYEGQKKGAPEFDYRHSGVRLERSGIDKLIPQKPVPARSDKDDWPEPPGREEFEREWLKPREVLDLLSGPLGGSQTAIDEVLRRAKVGRVIAAGEPRNDDDIETVHPKMWGSTEDADQVTDHLWKAASAIFDLSSSAGSGFTSVEYFSIRFKPDGIAAVLAANSVAAPPRAPFADDGESNRGRKPWPGWEAAWAEIVARVARRELVISQQKDIEDAFENVVDGKPKAPQGSAIRTRAKMVREALEAKGQKFRD